MPIAGCLYSTLGARAAAEGTDLRWDEGCRRQQPWEHKGDDLPLFFIGPDPSDGERTCWRQATVMMRSFPGAPTTLAPSEGCAGVAVTQLSPPLPPVQEVSCQL